MLHRELCNGLKPLVKGTCFPNVQHLVSVQLKGNPLCAHDELVNLLEPEWLKDATPNRSVAPSLRDTLLAGLNPLGEG